jgi:Tfp pilus assembly protein PilX
MAMPTKTPLLTRLAEERGIAVPLSMLVLALMVLLGGVAIRQAVFASDESHKDRRVKRAIQAADAGIEAAIYRMNMMDVTRQAANSKCVTDNGAGQLALTAAASGWCPAVTETLANGTSYSYRAQPSPDLAALPAAQTDISWTVVSTGAASGESRRVAARVTGPRASRLFGDYAVSAREGISLDSNATVTGSVRANRGIQLNSNARVNCWTDGTNTLGNATPGPGYTTTGSGSVCGSRAPAAETFSLAPVNSDVANTNDNGRICAAGGDPCSSAGSITWNPTSRVLRLNGGSTLTLGGSVYSLCQLHLDSDSRLIIAPRPAGSSVRIYLDKPADCPGVTGPAISFNSNATVTNQNSNPASLQFYVEGSRSITLNSNTTIAIPTVFYAPDSSFSMDSNSRILGAVVARTVHMNSNARVTWDPSVGNIWTDGVFPLASREDYRECQNPAPAGGPAAGC